MADRSSRGWGVRAAAVVLAAGLGLLPAGCVTETKKEPRGPVTVRTTGGPRPTTGGQQAPPPARGGVGSTGKPNELTDPCATRLHDLSGLLLTYYAVNKHLPDRLDELAPLADVDVPFETTCPASGRPYVYAPAGLQPSAGSDRSLVLYDAVPAHGGLRWGIFVAPPRNGQPPATWVILMSEEVFRGYVPRGQ
jgi:hypothetical protein